MAALDEHQIIHSAEAFKNCDKEGLIRGILRNYSDESKVLKIIQIVIQCNVRLHNFSHLYQMIGLAADLCLDYKIHDEVIWNNLLLKLCALNMVCTIQTCNILEAIWLITYIQVIIKISDKKFSIS